MNTQLNIIEHAEKRTRRLRSADDELDMTPMVDVTFLLLIFFMITAAFALQKAINVPPAKDDAASQAQVMEDPEDETVTIKVDEDNVFWVGAPLWEDEMRASSTQGMLVLLRKARAGRGGKYGAGPTRLIVQANGEAVHEKVVAALDAGMSVRMEEIQLMSYEEGDL
ncbi:MAG: biopolymer transporter ExbD [Pirellulales bacterium]|nr:biopolymer transporter ExbD [Pirellulales bacterium]